MKTGSDHMITYFVVQSFIVGRKGSVAADPPLQVPTLAQAARTAERLSFCKSAVIAFSRTGDPATGEYEPAMIICRFGDIPEDIADALAA
jgi:hypothetical protein